MDLLVGATHLLFEGRNGSSLLATTHGLLPIVNKLLVPSFHIIMFSYFSTILTTASILDTLPIYIINDLDIAYFWSRS